MKVATIAEKINNPVIGYVFFSAMFTNFNTYKYDLYVYENLRLKNWLYVIEYENNSLDHWYYRSVRSTK